MTRSQWSLICARRSLRKESCAGSSTTNSRRSSSQNSPQRSSLLFVSLSSMDYLSLSSMVLLSFFLFALLCRLLCTMMVRRWSFFISPLSLPPPLVICPPRLLLPGPVLPSSKSQASQHPFSKEANNDHYSPPNLAFLSFIPHL